MRGMNPEVEWLDLTDPDDLERLDELIDELEPMSPSEVREHLERRAQQRERDAST